MMAEGLSRWAYPAPLAEDTNFDGFDANLDRVRAWERTIIDRENSELHPAHSDLEFANVSILHRDRHRPLYMDATERALITRWEQPTVSHEARIVELHGGSVFRCLSRRRLTRSGTNFSLYGTIS